MKLTREIILAMRTPAGGFTRTTIEALGVEWPLCEGWIDRLVGVELSDERFREAQEGRHVKWKAKGRGTPLLPHLTYT